MSAPREKPRLSSGLILRCFLLSILLLMAGCFTPPDLERQATVDALAAKLEKTITAAALVVEDTPKPEKPSPTARDEPTKVQGTLDPAASTLAAQGGAQQTAAVPADAAAIQATTVAERSVMAQVPFFGVDANQGRVGWVHPSFTIEAVGPDGVANRNDFAAVVADDFVMSAKITWNTQYGDSGCGFVVRSDGNPYVPSQYMILLTRFANGHIGFLVLSKGELVNGADLYPRSEDRRFTADNDKTNQLTVVGRGHLFEIYTNGVLIGTVDPNQPPPVPDVPDDLPDKPTDPQQQKTYAALEQAQGQVEAEILERFAERKDLFEESNKEFPRGFTSMVAVTQGGKVTCTFDDAWLWLIEP